MNRNIISKMNATIVFVLLLLHVADYTNGQDVKAADKCLATADLPFSYGRQNENGPPNWEKTHPLCSYTRSKQSQSPINLYEDLKPNFQDETNFRFVGYDVPLFGVIKNNGANLVLYPNDGQERYIEVRGERCNLKHITFHFGGRSHIGSNHQLEGKAFPLEVDIANQCSERDANIAILLKEVDGPTPKVENFAEAAKLVVYQGDSLVIQKPVNLLNLTTAYCYDPKSGAKGDEFFYVYNGSYMYPPCTENVTWIVMSNPTSISTNLMKSFRSLRATTQCSEEQCYMFPNARWSRAPPNRRPINQTSTLCGDNARGRNIFSSALWNTGTADGDQEGVESAIIK